MKLFTQVQVNFIKQHYKLDRGELASRMNAEFNTSFTPEQVGGLRKRLKLRTGRTGQFVKGEVSWNSGKTGIHSGSCTSFKKGNRPHNAVPVGTETNSHDGYIKVKIAEPNSWAFKHRLLWEKEHGPIPKGKVLVFKDDDRTNIVIDNLELIDRWELVRLNKNRTSSVAPELKKSVKAIIKLDAKRFQLSKGEK